MGRLPQVLAINSLYNFLGISLETEHTRLGMGRGHGTGRGMVRNMPVFSEYDLDGDGRILEKEFNEARSKRISERGNRVIR